MPTRSLQFISLGKEPLEKQDLQGKLLTLVNEIFAGSSFGETEDEDPSIDKGERIAKNNDFRKKDFTNAQLRSAKKSHNRWPMLYLRYQCPELYGKPIRCVSNLSEVEIMHMINLLGASVTEWLQHYDFRPRRWKLIRRFEALDNSKFLEANSRSLRRVESDIQMHDILDQNPSNKSGDLQTITAKGPSEGPGFCMNSTDSTSLLTEIELGSRPEMARFWSQIKCDNPKKLTPLSANKIWDKRKHKSNFIENTNARSSYGSEDALNQVDINEVASEGLILRNEQQTYTDELIKWRDPSTGTEYMLNQRSGMMRPAYLKASNRKKQCAPKQSMHSTAKKLSYSPREFHMMDHLDTLSAKKMLEYEWKNPVFSPSSNRIWSVFDDTVKCRTLFDRNTEFCGEAALKRIIGIFKPNMENLNVVSQIDKKFILCTVRIGETVEMILIDQHAASERTIFERLLDEFCRPSDMKGLTQPSAMKSNLTGIPSIHVVCLATPLVFTLRIGEDGHCRRHAEYLARWGIMFNLHQNVKDPSSQSVEVFALPPVFMERFGTNLDATKELFYAVLYNDQIIDPEYPLNNQSHEVGLAGSADGYPWLRLISDCPDYMISALRSQACRSAIMFNDYLSYNECCNLVSSLAGCAFPLVCAHGRTAVVPLAAWSCADKAEASMFYC